MTVVGVVGISMLASCGGGGDGPSNIPIIQGGGGEALADMQKQMEDQKKAEAALAAPPKAGEFMLTISPGPDIREAFGIKVHVLSVNQGDVAQYRTMGADNYWRSPSGSAQEAVFGTSGKQQPVSFRVPSRDGADTVLIISKLPGSSPARILDYKLERQPGTDPMQPLAPSKRVTLSSNGLLPY